MTHGQVHYLPVAATDTIDHDTSVEAAVRAAFEPVIGAEILRVQSLGEAAREAAIKAALSQLVRPRKGWASMTPEERSEEISRRWETRKANAAARAAKPKGARSERRAFDYYATPEDATLAFLVVEGERLADFHEVAEPACGDGAISRLLEGRGLKVISSDLVDRGFGVGGVDFLKTTTCPEAVVTNPPFCHAREFIRHGLGNLGVKYLALLLQQSFFSSSRGAALFAEYPPAAIYPLTFRPKFRDSGNFITFAWHVWDEQRAGEQRVQPLGRAPQSADRP